MYENQTEKRPISPNGVETWTFGSPAILREIRKIIGRPGPMEACVLSFRFRGRVGGQSAVYTRLGKYTYLVALFFTDYAKTRFITVSW
jgi:hypothetical protein